jgi:hypothetical protein
MIIPEAHGIVLLCKTGLHSGSHHQRVRSSRFMLLAEFDFYISLIVRAHGACLLVEYEKQQLVRL